MKKHSILLMILLIISIFFQIHASSRFRVEGEYSTPDVYLESFRAGDNTSKEKVLVIGSGTVYGHHYPKNVYLIDISDRVGADLVVDIRGEIDERLNGQFDAIIWENVDKDVLIHRNTIDNIKRLLNRNGRFYLSLRVLDLAEKSGGIRDSDPAGGSLIVLDKGIFYYYPIDSVSSLPFICYYDSTSTIYSHAQLLGGSGDEEAFTLFNAERNGIIRMYYESVFATWLESKGFNSISKIPTENLLGTYWFQRDIEEEFETYMNYHIICSIN